MKAITGCVTQFSRLPKNIIGIHFMNLVMRRIFHPSERDEGLFADVDCLDGDFMVIRKIQQINFSPQ